MEKQPKTIVEIKKQLWWYRILKFISEIPFNFSTLLRLIWLLLPSVFFVVATFFCFWSLPQGKDVLIATLERGWTRGLVLLAVLFFALVTWYSSRVLVYRKEQIYKDSQTLCFHGPRVLGFTIFTILIIGMLKIPALPEQGFTIRISNAAAIWLLIGSFFAYSGLYLLFKRIRESKLLVSKETEDKTLLEKKVEDKRFKLIYILLGCFVSLILIANFLFYNALGGWFFWVSLILLQLCFLFIIIIRRGRLPDKFDPEMPLHFKTFKLWREYEISQGKNISASPWQKLLYYSNISSQEKWFFKVYNVIGLVSLLIYVVVIFNYSFAITLGSLGTVMLAFGVLAGILSFISFFSLVLRINFYAILFLLALLIGGKFEPHRVNILSDTKANYKNDKTQRPVLKQYFSNWLKSRKAELDTTTKEYPLFFVLADGGASRSGYWTATVLGKLQDTTAGKFSHHLFCLSGASGGSVGNGTFMALLKYRNELAAHANHTYKNGAAAFLKNDFLSSTLARMLGPDIIRPMLAFIPISKMGDRAEALEYSMEQAGSKDSTFLHNKFETPFLELSSNTNPNDSLPIFCINCTRMQDGRPSVVSNIKLEEQIFGKRIDILNGLDSGEDLKLSSAVALGARFPYISPAGRIHDSYFVDGGYFDNSGSGFVAEMITELRKLQSADTSIMNISQGVKKLGFYIIHVQNGEASDIVPHKINPLMNDLAAPVSTLVGAYGTQTSVNDWRLQKYMNELDSLHSNGFYFKVNLYRGSPEGDAYPMNWAISDYYIKRMDKQLNNPQMLVLIRFLKREFGW